MLRYSRHATAAPMLPNRLHITSTDARGRYSQLLCNSEALAGPPQHHSPMPLALVRPHPLPRCTAVQVRHRAAGRLVAGRRAAQLRVAAAAGGGAAPPVTLQLAGGTQVAMPSSSLVVGSAADADLQLEGSGVAAQHARLGAVAGLGGLGCCSAGGPQRIIAGPHTAASAMANPCAFQSCETHPPAAAEWKGGRLFCTTLSADPDMLLAPTNCWLDGVELRPGVSYMVAPGARLAVGSQDNSLTCSFQEGGSSAMTELLMKVRKTQLYQICIITLEVQARECCSSSCGQVLWQQLPRMAVCLLAHSLVLHAVPAVVMLCRGWRPAQARRCRRSCRACEQS